MLAFTDLHTTYDIQWHEKKILFGLMQSLNDPVVMYTTGIDSINGFSICHITVKFVFKTLLNVCEKIVESFFLFIFFQNKALHLTHFVHFVHHWTQKSVLLLSRTQKCIWMTMMILMIWAMSIAHTRTSKWDALIDNNPTLDRFFEFHVCTVWQNWDYRRHSSSFAIMRINVRRDRQKKRFERRCIE